MQKSKSELLSYYHMPEHLNDEEIKRLYYYVFGVKAHSDYNMNHKYLVHSFRHPEIYKTRFNK